MPEIERDGEDLPRLSSGVGCDATAQGNKVTAVGCKCPMCLFRDVHFI